jgi:hypothetical protein
MAFLLFVVKHLGVQKDRMCPKIGPRPIYTYASSHPMRHATCCVSVELEFGYGIMYVEHLPHPSHPFGVKLCITPKNFWD